MSSRTSSILCGPLMLPWLMTRKARVKARGLSLTRQQNLPEGTWIELRALRSWFVATRKIAIRCIAP